MSFDKDTRNLLAKTVTACRRRLAGDVTDQLRGLFGLHPDGVVLPLEKLTHLSPDQHAAARRLRGLLDYYAFGAAGNDTDRRKAAYERMVLEISFTALNRLAALCLCEERGLVVECVRKGTASAGFQMFERISGGAIGGRYDTYRVFLECLFDELALDLGVLFDRTTPQSAVFPSERCIEDVLAELNKPELTHLWTEDETIGWVYQYFNPPEERKAMRDASQAPRNSRELAVRNQFFTPRYVVEFLTDNTLGRIWYEMRKGDTALKEECRYLVHRSDEVFFEEPSSPEASAAQDWLQGNETPEPDIWNLAHTVNGYLRAGPSGEPSNGWVEERLPRLRSFESVDGFKTQELLDLLFLFCRKERFCEGTLDSLKSEIGNITAVLCKRVADGKREDRSQEELLKAPAYIQHRPKKNPRDLRVLDPACGSGHFLLYAFDLLERIYEEAWSDPESPKSEVTGRTIRQDFETLDDLRRATPKLIVEHNLHGIDIDPRAVQIAALALWLRAQKTWKNLGLKASERLSIARSNIVTAEPMPGEDDMRREFTAGLKPRVLGQIVDEVFEKMKLAGEAGSLLKIEEEIKDAVAAAGKQWREDPKPEQQFILFPGMANPRPKQQELRFDVDGITDEGFWEQAEDRILDALKDYAEQAENGRATRRRLFAEDAAKGFAFIDLCRKRYDVVLMNPPFGDASLPSKPYIDETYGDTKGDVYKAFVECFNFRLVPAGYLGIISSRTGFFLGQSEDWRTRVVLRLFRPIALADLGSGVLDAMVEVAAYVLRSLSDPEVQVLTLSLVPVLEKVVRDKQDRFGLPKWQAARDGLKRYQALAELQYLEASGFIRRCTSNTIRYMPVWQKVKEITPLPEPVFPPLVCIRTLAEKDKGTALAECLLNLSDPRVFSTNPREFKKVPSSPFSYWVSNRVRNLFTMLPKAEADTRRIALGLSTKNDVRFVRVWWEVDSSAVGRNKTWANYANGGSFSPFYYAYPTVVLAEDGCAQLRAYLIAKFPYLGGNAGWILHDENDYRSPAIAWPLRTHAFSPAFLPANFFFSARTYVALMSLELLPCFVGLFASKTVDFLLKVSLGRAGHPEYVTGVVRTLPIPAEVTQQQGLAYFAKSAWSIKRDIGSTEPTSHAFVYSSLLAEPGSTLAERALACAYRVRMGEDSVATFQTEIDNIVFRLYGFDAADRVSLTAILTDESPGNVDIDENEEKEVIFADVSTLTNDLLDYFLGATFGRWDVRLSLDPSLVPAQPNPFDPLPVCPPGMLVGPDGLPAEANRIVSEEWLRARPDANTLPSEDSVKTPTIPDSEYPLRISWDGVLVDDPGFNGDRPHRDDIVRRVREVFDLVWKDKAPEIEQEACNILGVSDLRDYFRRPAGFFQDHLKRYSKSRRKAPIYWPLSTASGSYTIWIYYHRLNDQTLYGAVNKYVDPKISEVERGIAQIENDLKAASGHEATRLTDRLGEARTFAGELRDLREELLRIAALPYRPDLNDGVIINAAPFHKLFRLRSWAEDTVDCWKKLEKGDYDWAHLAYTIWPDRVRDVCKRDRSIAIAHDLEDLCEVEALESKKKGGRGRPKMEATR